MDVEMRSAYPINEAAVTTPMAAATSPSRSDDLTGGFSLEIHPESCAQLNNFALQERGQTRVFLPHLHRGCDLQQIRAAQWLREQGFEPIPHIAARGIANKAQLAAHLDALVGEAGVRDLLLIGGSFSPPYGDFAATEDILASGLITGDRFRCIGLAGHPEGAAYMGLQEETVFDTLLQTKIDRLAALGCRSEIVTQFIFDADPVIAWLTRLRGHGISVPVRLGLAGPARLKTLISYARRCGVGASSRLLRKQARQIGRLLTVSTPDDMVTAMGNFQRSVEPEYGLDGLHFFPFGGIKALTDWLERRRAD